MRHTKNSKWYQSFPDEPWIVFYTSYILILTSAAVRELQISVSFAVLYETITRCVWNLT